MSSIVLLVTDRPAFEQSWQTALAQAGLQTETIGLDGLGDALSRQRSSLGLGVVVDAETGSYDEDDVLAHLGMARAMGAVPAVSLTPGNGMAGVEDVLDDLCVGLVSRSNGDLSRVVQGLARRCDAARAGRFEYVTVAPQGGSVLAILGDGTSMLLARPVTEQDDGSEITNIELAEDAGSATLSLASGIEFSLAAKAMSTRGRESRPRHAGDGHGLAGSLTTESSNGAQDLLGLTLDGPRLGARLRTLRLAAGLTQAELARRTGIHRPNIARVEAGRHTPSLETLGRLASAIGISPTELFALS